MSTKKGKALPVDREIPDGTVIISVVNPEGNPAGVTVEETVIKDNTPRPDIGTNVGEALEKALQKDNEPKSSKTKTNQEANKMEEKKTATATNTETTTATEAKPQQSAPKKTQAEEKPKAAVAAPKAEQPAAAVPEENPQQFGDMIAELKTLKGELATSTRVEVEHFRRTDNTGRECGHQFLVGLATGAGVALGVTIVSTAAWLIQRKLSGNGESPAE